MKYLSLASTVLFAVSVVSSSALAAPTPDASPVEPMKIPYASYTSHRAVLAFSQRQREILIEAQALEKAGKIQEALDRYKDAFDILPYSDATLELAFAQARAGLFLAAARNIQDVMTTFAGLDSYKLYSLAEVREVFAYVKKYIGTINIRLNIPGARVTVDGEVVKDWPYHEEIYVEAGKHSVKAIADGYYTNQTDIEIEAGERKAVQIAMQQRIQGHYLAFPATPIKTSIHADISRATNNDQPTWPKGLMIASGVGMWLGVAALAVGLVQVNNAESKSAAATWTGVATVGGILGGLSLTGLIIGLVNRPEPPPPNVIITPQFAKGAGGVQVTGTLE
ncbi:PEGA domain-containing protein [Polyangium sp. 15x6]|uniref:PEGA domain-containing protein n=1 Tax=Polyangium sp. 15x6 TaxID=3042687 RepID=UPI00249AF130|nr:PEGA domain-containing protein [Polyangium sp. 15x6]MDI3291792.1 PEGA domain-containing protein [Polyangium sp. 15x6]